MAIKYTSLHGTGKFRIGDIVRSQINPSKTYRITSRMRVDGNLERYDGIMMTNERGDSCELEVIGLISTRIKHI